MMIVASLLSLALLLPPLPDLKDGAGLKAAHFISPTANWVVPGRLLQGDSKLDGAKDDTFLCALQVEDPPADAHLFYPIKNGEPAHDLTTFSALVVSLVGRVRAGETPVYVTCPDGLSQSGIVSACLMALLYELGAEEALARVDAYCATRGAGLASPATDAQREQVQQVIRKARASDCADE